MLEGLSVRPESFTLVSKHLRLIVSRNPLVFQTGTLVLVIREDDLLFSQLCFQHLNLGLKV